MFNVSTINQSMGIEMWQQKFDFDICYVENLSFWIDIKILFLTLKKVFVREGISQEGQATMEPFKGNL